MKKVFYIPVLVLALMSTVHTAAAQDSAVQTSVQITIKKQQDFYQRHLGVDSTLAVQVTKIQQEYKSALKQLWSDPVLEDAEKRNRMKRLMEMKNGKLRHILTPAQQEKIIPTTERGDKSEAN